MTDIYETERAYYAACKNRGVSGHSMIEKVLAVDKKENFR